MASSEEPVIKIKTSVSKKRKKKISNIYSLCLITRNVSIPITNVGRNLNETLERVIAQEIEGKCISEGFIKPSSIKLITFSSGLIKEGGINFEVLIECMVCAPVEGMVINCVAKNITKAGIRAEIDDEYNPLVIFVARDHNYMSEYFGKILEGENIQIKVIGQRFELFDKFVSIIGQLIEKSSKSKK